MEVHWQRSSKLKAAGSSFKYLRIGFPLSGSIGSQYSVSIACGGIRETFWIWKWWVEHVRIRNQSPSAPGCTRWQETSHHCRRNAVEISRDSTWFYLADTILSRPGGGNNKPHIFAFPMTYKMAISSARFYQYDLPNIVHLLASWPHAVHLVLPGSIAGQRDWSNGIARDLAPALGARSSVGSDLHIARVSFTGPKKKRLNHTHALALLSLISSSHASTSHHGITTIDLLSKVGTTSSHLVTGTRRASYASLARANMSFCIVSSKAWTTVSTLESEIGFFAPVSLRAVRVWDLARSLGPISSRSGTPWCYTVKKNSNIQDKVRWHTLSVPNRWTCIPACNPPSGQL